MLYWAAGALATGILGFAIFGMIDQQNPEHLFKMFTLAGLAIWILVAGKATKEWLIASAKKPPRVGD